MPNLRCVAPTFESVSSYVLRTAVYVIALGGLLSRTVHAQGPRAVLRDEPIPVQNRGALVTFPVDGDDRAVSFPILDLQQAENGLLYTASGRGLGVFDGVRWQRVRVGTDGAASSLSIRPDGQVWVGGIDDLGWIGPDSLGSLDFISLRPRLPRAARPEGAVDILRATEGEVVFATGRQLVRWRDGARTLRWRARGDFRISIADSVVYVQDTGRGLFRLQGDRLIAVPGGRQFRESVIVLSTVGGRELVMTGRAFWVREGAAFVPRPTEADAVLRDHPALLPGVRWVQGLLGIPTVGGGLVLLRPDGRLHAVVDATSGLPDDSPRRTAADRAGGLWVASETGLVRVLAPRTLRRLGEAEGLNGVVLDVETRAGQLAVATSRGLHLRSASGRFELVDGLAEVVCQDVFAGPYGLLAGCASGLFQVEKGRSTPIFPYPVMTLASSGRQPGRIWVGSDAGVAPLVREGTSWRMGAVVPGTEGRVSSILEVADGTLWVGYNESKVVRVRFVEGGLVQTETYTRKDGFGKTTWTFVWDVGGDVAVTSKHGLFRFRPEASPVFVKDHGLGTLFDETSRGSPEVFRLAKGVDGEVWRYGGASLGVARPSPEGYTWHSDPVQSLTALPGQYYALTVGPDGTTWLGGAGGLLQIAPGAVSSAPPRPYAALVRQLDAVDADSVLWDGAGDPALELAPELNALRFTFAAPRLAASTTARYRHRLVPFETAWSAWSDATVKEYTNVPPGAYRFEVQAVDLLGQESEPGVLAFSLLAPWYATAWARVLWVLLGLAALGAVVSGGVQWRTRQLRVRELALEAEVADRTEALARENRRTEAALLDAERARAEAEEAASTIEAQRQELARLDEAKSRFFADVSHELRTPLTLALGPLGDLREGRHGTLSEAARGAVDLAERNARRLLRLVNQVLDVAAIEAGHLQIQRQPADLGILLHRIAEPFADTADRHRIALTVETPERPITAWIDARHIETLVGNLLSNALKFTPEGGRVRVRLDGDDEGAEVSVLDTGPGITPEHLSRVFERFFQAEKSERQPGSGIGLALARELASLHGGTLTAESIPGKGARFVLWLPRDASAAPEEVSEAWSDLQHEGDGQSPDLPLLPDAASEGVGSGPDVPTVLVVDDNADIRAFVRGHLEERGYAVSEAAHGQAALRSVRHRLPDLIVSDVMMPQFDGFALTRALRADPETDFIPIVLLTARAAAQDRLEGLSAEADDYLTKPFDPAELVARVDNLIAVRRRLRVRFADAATPCPEVLSDDDAFRLRVQKAIASGLPDDTFGVDALAVALGMSRSTLHRRLTAVTGQVPGEAIRLARLDHASSLLRANAGTISEVAYGVGFRSLAHFSTQFKAQFGMTPSAYKAAHAEAA